MYYGIDLGTTTTLIAEPIIKGSSFDARAIKIPQLGKQGNRIEKEILPSYAYFPEGKEPIVGTFAREAPDVSKSVRAIKRFMGRDIEPYTFNGREYFPSDISSLFIEHAIKEAIFKDVDAKVNKLTVTVPASFTTKQRKDTVAAIQKAFERTGVKFDENVLISEPLAALLSYISYDILNGFNKVNIDARPLILVYDIGGGTLDLTLVRLGWINSGNEKNLGNVDFKIEAVGRYNQVGGEDFDERIAEWLLERLLEQNIELDVELTWNERVQVRHQLMMIAERRKIQFNDEYGEDEDPESGKETVYLRGKEYQFDVMLSKKDMLKALEPLLGQHDGPKNCVTCIDKFLSKNTRNKDQIDHILCVGGMSKFLMLREAINHTYNTNILFSKTLADVAVAQGAAIYSYMKGRFSHTIQEPRSDAYYVKTVDDFTKILGCYEESRTTDFSTVYDSNYIDLFIFSGEDCKGDIADSSIYPSLMFQEATKIPLGSNYPKNTPMKITISNTGDNKMPSYEIIVDGKTVHFSEMEV
jgi:molecular chaperone DnaK